MDIGDIVKISIIGAGSLGLLYGYYLADNHEITYYIKNEQQINEINKYGISLTTDDLVIKKVKADKIKNFKAQDLIIVALKQTEIEWFINENRSSLNKQPILFLQNGLSHIEYIKKFNLEALIGIVEHGAIKVGHQQVSHLGVGVTKVASYSLLTNELKEVVNKLNDKTLNFVYHKDWKEISYEKLIINAVINPLTAIYDVPNGEILANLELKNLSEKICREAAEILELDFVEQWENVKRVCSLTSENTSSMRADIIAKRETEIEAIVGYLLAKSNINSPYLDYIYKRIKLIERRGDKDA